MEIALIFIVFVVVVLLFRLMAGAMDGDRIERYAKEQGWTVVTRSWTPFGPGWLGSQNERLYTVTYRNREGETRQAVIKTAMVAGVYVTEDRVVKSAQRKAPADLPRDDVAQLREENERLRRRIAELEGRRS